MVQAHIPAHVPAQPSVGIMPAKKDTVVSFLIILFVALFAYIGLNQSQRPAVAGLDAPAADFSASRAMKHLAVIAQQPHPIGSSAHAKVRDYIASELTALGLSPEIQKTSVVNTSLGAPFAAGHVENVVARLKGVESGRAIMLVSHYDSTTNSFGASDNGTAVATLLETARALKSSTPLKDDLIFLFTDGEEAGLLGAKAFVDEHPWAKDVRLVLNFDARGNSGSAMARSRALSASCGIQSTAAATDRDTRSSKARPARRTARAWTKPISSAARPEKSPRCWATSTSPPSSASIARRYRACGRRCAGRRAHRIDAIVNQTATLARSGILATMGRVVPPRPLDPSPTKNVIAKKISSGEYVRCSGEC